MTKNSATTTHTAAFAEAFFIGNLLFVGIFYLALWILYLKHYRSASAIDLHHLKQALLASSISTAVFLLINSFILLTGSYASVTALFSLEFYFMLIVPVFLIAGISGFTKAIKGKDYSYPLIGQWLKPSATA